MPQIEERLQNEGRVKQAVKEALTERDITTLRNGMDELKRQIAEGFKGMHERQDTTNGKVLKARDDILELKAEAKTFREKLKTISKIQWAVGSAVGLTVLAAILRLVIK